MSLIMKTYLRSPYLVKRALINLEAIRRDLYRKYGNYEELYNSIDFERIMSGEGLLLKNKIVGTLIKDVQNEVPYYKKYPKHTQIEEFPLMSKDEYSKNIKDLVADNVNIEKCFKSRTSGSTGMPLTYYHHRSSERMIKIYQEKFFEFLGITKDDNCARISGVPITTYNRKEPPFWVYIDKYKQLQFSAYHISDTNVSSYFEAMKTHQITYGTGYASAWLFLAEYIDRFEVIPPKFKAIITDSEGVTHEQQSYIEKIFACPVHQTYGLGETGQIAVQCRKGNYHIIPTLCHAEVINASGDLSSYNDSGEIVLTSLISNRIPVIRYKTGDYGTLGNTRCGCGWNTQYFSSIDGRLDDYVIDLDGRKIGRLSHIIKPARGVLESQIIQEKYGEIKLLVIPNSNFDKDSMQDVIENAKKYLGDMAIKWETVTELEKTKTAKVRRVIRRVSEK